MQTQRLRDIPDDAPATAFAAHPPRPYARGFEDAQERAWWCPWRCGSAEARERLEEWAKAPAIEFGPEVQP